MTSILPRQQTLKYTSKDLFLLFVIVSTIFCLPIYTVFSFPVYILAVTVIHFRPRNYGKFIGYFDAWMDEDFVTKIPRSTVVTTLGVQGDLDLEELRRLFNQNVLESSCDKKSEQIRYPELKQYLTTFMGFRIWKNDEQFDIKNHIVERSSNDYHWNNKWDWDRFLGNIHEEWLNVPYQKNRSPWELTLIRNLKDHEDNPVSLLACRTHHVLADGKSLIKLLVGGLGQKPIKLAGNLKFEESFEDKLKMWVTFPINYFVQVLSVSWNCFLSHLHPWKTFEYWKDREVKTVVAFSPKLLLKDLKQTAKGHGVAGSAVVMTIVAGGIRRCGLTLWEKAVTIGYPFPKPNHPEMLTNHLYMGFVKLPTNEADAAKRLRLCNDNFLKVKSSSQNSVINIVTLLGGMQFYQVTRLAVNQFSPLGITNIAGDEEGFKVGKGECTDFRMSVGTLGGVAGVVFCAFSYKDGIRIAVIAKESILGKDKAEKLAYDIGEEFKSLKNVNANIIK